VTAGYSGTPLAKKLGIKPNATVGIIGPGKSFAPVLEPLPEAAVVVEAPDEICDVLLVAAVAGDELERRFATAIDLLPADGGLWVAWPKKNSGMETELGFDVVQSHGLAAGLVDNKVCAIDETWSGLRFVVRTADRPAWPR
jgi:hypothetical protein